jgi:hypothetical protein
LPEHVVWSLKCYVFGVIVVLKTVEKTHVLTMPTPNLSDESIWRFLLVVLQYLEQVYQLCWYYVGMFVGMFVGRFVYFFVGTDSMWSYDSNTMKEVY